MKTKSGDGFTEYICDIHSLDEYEGFFVQKNIAWKVDSEGKKKNCFYHSLVVC